MAFVWIKAFAKWINANYVFTEEFTTLPISPLDYGHMSFQTISFPFNIYKTEMISEEQSSLKACTSTASWDKSGVFPSDHGLPYVLKDSAIYENKKRLVCMCKIFMPNIIFITAIESLFLHFILFFKFWNYSDFTVQLFKESWNNYNDFMTSCMMMTQNVIYRFIEVKCSLKQKSLLLIIKTLLWQLTIINNRLMAINMAVHFVHNDV